MKEQSQAEDHHHKAVEGNQYWQGVDKEQEVDVDHSCQAGSRNYNVGQAS